MNAVQAGQVPIPARPGPTPACSDSELLTVALVRHLLGRPSERASLAEVADTWPDLFPHLPAQCEFNRRIRWLWGTFELLRAQLAATLPADPWQQVDTSALPVKHPSRVRGPDGWTGPNQLRAGFGRHYAHAEWFYGFRLAVRTDLASRLVRAWGIVPAAVDERAVADRLLDGSPPPAGLLCDRGFLGRAWQAAGGAGHPGGGGGGTWPP
jgi:Transposase DDE domain